MTKQVCLPLGTVGSEDVVSFVAVYSIFRVIKSRRLRWAGHVARMGRGEVHTGLWWGNLREGDHLEDPGVDGRTTITPPLGPRPGGAP
jgi:hypothetical protein